MTPKSKAVLAREHLDRARPAVTAEDYTEAVTWLFASLEAAVVGVAEARGLTPEKSHWNKANVAGNSTSLALCLRTSRERWEF